MRNYLFIGAGVLVFGGILIVGSYWEAPANETLPPSPRIIVNSNGNLGAVRPTSSSLSLNPLPAWGVIAADVLEPTFVAGYEVTGTGADFASVRTLRVEFPRPRSQTPIVWYRDDGFVLPLDPVRYFMTDGGIAALEFDLLGAGEYYLLQHNQHTGDDPIFAGLTLTHEMRDAYTGQFRFVASDGVVPIGYVADEEVGVMTPLPIDRFVVTLRTGGMNRPLPIIGDVTVDGLRRIAFGGQYECNQVLANDSATLTLTADIGPERRTRPLGNWLGDTASAGAWTTGDETARTRLHFHFDGFTVCGSGI